MPRVAKPYVERGWYVSRPHGVYLRLCPAEDGMTEARRVLKVRLGELERDREQSGGRLPAKLTVVEMMALFLEAVQVEKDGDTFLYYQRWCTEFARDYGPRPARGVTKTDAHDFKMRLMRATYTRGNQPPKKYSPKTVTRDANKEAGKASKRSVQGWLSALNDAGLVEQTRPSQGKVPARWKVCPDGEVAAGLTVPPVGDVFPGCADAHKAEGGDG